MITGKPDGIRMFDLSVDGFWNSFFAIIIALPVLIVGWVPLANEIAGADSTLGLRFGILLRLGVVDLGAWLLPVAVLMLVAGSIGIRDRFVPLVVASNWGSAIYAWAMLPPALVRLLFPAVEDLSLSFSLIIFIVTLVLSWRLMNAAINKGAGIASGVFAGMLACSITAVFVLQELLGVTPPQ